MKATVYQCKRPQRVYGYRSVQCYILCNEKVVFEQCMLHISCCKFIIVIIPYNVSLKVPFKIIHQNASTYNIDFFMIFVNEEFTQSDVLTRVLALYCPPCLRTFPNGKNVEYDYLYNALSKYHDLLLALDECLLSAPH